MRNDNQINDYQSNDYQINDYQSNDTLTWTTNDLRQRRIPQLCQNMSHFLRDISEERHDIVGLTGEAFAKGLVLGSNAYGAFVGVANTCHDTAFCDHRDGAEAVFFGTHGGCHHHIPSTVLRGWVRGCVDECV